MAPQQYAPYYADQPSMHAVQMSMFDSAAEQPFSAINTASVRDDTVPRPYQQVELEMNTAPARSLDIGQDLLDPEYPSIPYPALPLAIPGDLILSHSDSDAASSQYRSMIPNAAVTFTATPADISSGFYPDPYHRVIQHNTIPNFEIVPPSHRGVKRGPFKDPVAREETAKTRKRGSCMRCRGQRSRVSGVDILPISHDRCACVCGVWGALGGPHSPVYMCVLEVRETASERYTDYQLIIFLLDSV